MTVATPTDALTSTSPGQPARPVYLDCNATTPVDPQVLQEVMRYMVEEYGNAGSRTHTYGQAAKERVNLARQQVAEVVDARPDEVIFTSGATESNNLAILGLAAYGEQTARRHIISTQIEHKAVLEPLQALAERGFEVTLLPPNIGGWIEPEMVRKSLRPDTLLVSVMGVNNETGVIQPLDEISAEIGDHDAFFHVDGAQAFGKLIEPLRKKRIDMLSISGHKIYAPKGVGALVIRRRGYRRIPLQPLLYGGGQERGLRPGTLPVHLIAGMGEAATSALHKNTERASQSADIRRRIIAAIAPLGISFNGDQERTISHVINFSIAGIDGEAAIIALKDIAAISNGSACTSHKYEPSHVLAAMNLPPAQIAGALRLSWSHLTPAFDCGAITARLSELKNENITVTQTV